MFSPLVRAQRALSERPSEGKLGQRVKVVIPLIQGVVAPFTRRIFHQFLFLHFDSSSILLLFTSCYPRSYCCLPPVIGETDSSVKTSTLTYPGPCHHDSETNKFHYRSVVAKWTGPQQQSRILWSPVDRHWDHRIEISLEDIWWICEHLERYVQYEIQWAPHRQWHLYADSLGPTRTQTLPHLHPTNLTV